MGTVSAVPRVYEAHRDLQDSIRPKNLRREKKTTKSDVILCLIHNTKKPQQSSRAAVDLKRSVTR
jgi:hypothetical protein